MDHQEIKTFKRREKKNDTNSAHQLFDKLPEELKIDILCRISPTKLVATLALVSKSWYSLITTHCFPKATSKLPFIGIVLIGGYQPRPCTTILVETTQYLGSSSLLPNNVERSKHYPFNLTSRNLVVDCCNGLLLFCCRDDQAKRSYNYSYNVYNPFTNQWMTTNYMANKPAAATTAKSTAHMYAALAYNPSESSFYRIVQFRGFRCLDVYYSETRSWKKLKYRLSNHISSYKTKWAKPTVFFQGAIYRLSMSGHLLRFMIEKEASVLKDQAQAIDLPNFEVAKNRSKGNYCLGVNNDHINFMAFDKELNLCIWVLTNTNEWLLRSRLSKIHEMYELENNFCRPLAFHPYLDVVFVGINSLHFGSFIALLNFGKDICAHGQDEYVFEALSLHDCQPINWHDVLPFPFLYCHIPFASGLTDNIALQMER